MPRLKKTKLKEPKERKPVRVTAVLSFVESAWKEYWFRSIGFEAADKITKESSAFGTSVHKKIEQALKNEIVLHPESNDPEDLCAVAAIMYLEEQGFKPLFDTYDASMEIEVEDKDLGIIGHFDYAAIKNNRPYIVDFKTSKAMRKSFPVQKAAYAVMANNQLNSSIDDGVTIRVHWNKETQEVEVEGKEYSGLTSFYWPIFKDCLSVYNYFNGRKNS